MGRPSATRVAYRHLRSKTAAMVKWDEDDVLLIEPLTPKMRSFYPASTVLRKEKVMATTAGASDVPGVFSGVLGGGQEVQFYGWQVVSQARMASGAPSAEQHFWHNPERYEVREFAETKALSNDPEIAADAGKDMGLTRREIRQDVKESEASPPLPTEIEDEPGGGQFSTLNRYLVQTDQPDSGVPAGVVKRPMTPDTAEYVDGDGHLGKEARVLPEVQRRLAGWFR